jgi:hypothetical protein
MRGNAPSAMSLSSILRFRINSISLGVTENTGVLPWWGERWHNAAFVFFLLCWGLCITVRLTGDAPDWMMNLVLWSGLLTSVVTLGRQLPLQNVVLAGIVFGLAAAIWVWDWSEGPNWQRTVFWTIVLLNARAIGQFLLRFRRRTPFYGWELMGLSAFVFMLSAALYTKVARMFVAPLFMSGLQFITLPLMLSKRTDEPPANWHPIVVQVLLLSWGLLPQV